jgi:drug/metabolite transporter (DMT)-like permease
VARFTWLAMLLAVFGVALMVASGMEEGGLLGIGIALLAPISFAIMIVAIRKRTDRDMTPMLPLAGLISMAVGFAFSDTLVISTSDLAYALFLGVAQIGISFILITLGSRLVPSAQVPLLALSETVLAPIWVWMAFNEQPAKFALLGGLVVLVAVVAEAIAGIRREANRVKSS